MSPVYLAAIALVIAVVIVIAVVGSKKHAKTPSQAQQLFDDEKTKQDDDLFEDVEIMADQDNGPSLEERRRHTRSAFDAQRNKRLLYF